MKNAFFLPSCPSIKTLVRVAKSDRAVVDAGKQIPG